MVKHFVCPQVFSYRFYWNLIRILLWLWRLSALPLSITNKSLQLFLAIFCIFLLNTIFGYQFIFKENLKIIWRRFSWDFLLHPAIIKTHYPCVMYWNLKYFEAFELRNNGEDIIYDPWCLRRFFTTFMVHRHLRCKGRFTLSVNVNSAMLLTIYCCD